jgi:hypothetical protein
MFVFGWIGKNMPFFHPSIKDVVKGVGKILAVSVFCGHVITF